MLPPGLHLRRIPPEDTELLFRVYARTRADELAQVAWPEAKKAAFLRMQFHAQHSHYQAHCTGADFLVLMRGQEALGRLYVDRHEEALRILDMALAPEHRGAGLGTALLQEVMEEATRTARVVRLSLERTSPALRLCRRLGFREVAGGDGPLQLEWAPSPGAARAPGAIDPSSST